MTREQVRTFYQTLSSDATLRLQYEAVCKSSHKGYEEEKIIAFAKEQGYNFTWEELHWERWQYGENPRASTSYDYEPTPEPKKGNLSKKQVRAFYARLSEDSSLRTRYKEACKRTGLFSFVGGYIQEKILIFAKACGYDFSGEELDWERYNGYCRGSHGHASPNHDYEPTREPQLTPEQPFWSI